MRVLSAVPAVLVQTFSSSRVQYRSMVNLHGHTFLSAPKKTKFAQVVMQSSLRTENLEPPPNPSTLLSEAELKNQVDALIDWWEDKQNVLCITGAGLSTESGLADYRGHTGSYHRGHKPMIHDHFMGSEYQRKRYWGRGLVGWRNFDTAKPNIGHHAIASLEQSKRIGVTFDDSADFYAESDSSDFLFSSGQRQMTIITQNVDTLHRRAGSKHVTELHGRTDLLTCMSCGAKRDRNEFQSELERINNEWLADALNQIDETEQRPDGDAALQKDDYEQIHVPGCESCGEGFFKPHVVFFGDTVPRHRVDRCVAAVNAADGILVVGSSLAVWSAFRHIRAAHQKGTPIAILNVGETRAEIESLDVTKIEAPAGPTLAAVAEHFEAIADSRSQ